MHPFARWDPKQPPLKPKRTGRPDHFQHSKRTVKLRARSAIAVASVRVLEGFITKGILFASRKAFANEDLIAKFTFWGISTIKPAISNASSLLEMTPTTLPESSKSGPPLFPGWTGDVICKKRISLRLGIPLTQQTTICRFRVWRTIRGRSRNSKIVFRPKKAVGPMC